MISPELINFFLSIRNPLLTEVFVSLTALGSIVFGVVICLSLLLLSREEGLQALTGLGLAYATTHVLKLVFQTPRPAASTMLVEVSTYAFPSGHTTVAFSLAVILSRIERKLKYYFFSLAALVGVSRLYLGVHSLIDVVAGAIIGYGATKLAVSVSYEYVESSRTILDSN